MTRRSKNQPWPCTAEDLIRERDEKGLSWKQVSTNLDLGNPSAARRAYTELTGRHHSDSQPIVKRAPKGHNNTGRKMFQPMWNDDSDQAEIEIKLNGSWVEAKGEPGTKNYRPGHWSGSRMTVRRSLAGREWDEEVFVSWVSAFTYGPEGDQPLQITIVDRDNGASRTFRAESIISVA